MLDLTVFRSLDREECAVLIGRVKDGSFYVDGCVRVPNHAKKNSDYEIKGSDIVRVLETLQDTPYQVVGFLHTHLPHHKPGPSQSDIDGVVYKASINAVWHPAKKILSWYTSQGEIGEEAVVCEYTAEHRDASGRVRK